MTFYIQIKQEPLWENISAKKINFPERSDAVKFCIKLAEFMEKEVRLCDNDKLENGSYFSS